MVECQRSPQSVAGALITTDIAGLCDSCGQHTLQVCANCKRMHFCCLPCLRDPSRRHETTCGWEDWPDALLPPPEVAADTRHNRRLLKEGVFQLTSTETAPQTRLFGINERYGLFPTTFSAAHAAALGEWVDTSRDNDDLLVIGGVAFKGYHRYPVIEAVTVVGREHQKATAVFDRYTLRVVTLVAPHIPASGLKRARAAIALPFFPHRRKSVCTRSRTRAVPPLDQICFALEHCPPMKALVAEACGKLRCNLQRLKFIHVIRQCSPQARFTWHVDTQDTGGELTDSMITVIVLLAGSNTGMQMWGFERFRYSHEEGEVGGACIFAGAAVHRTVYQVQPPQERWD